MRSIATTEPAKTVPTTAAPLTGGRVVGRQVAPVEDQESEANNDGADRDHPDRRPGTGSPSPDASSHLRLAPGGRRQLAQSGPRSRAWRSAAVTKPATTKSHSGVIDVVGEGAERVGQPDVIELGHEATDRAGDRSRRHHGTGADGVLEPVAGRHGVPELFGPGHDGFDAVDLGLVAGARSHRPRQATPRPEHDEDRSGQPTGDGVGGEAASHGRRHAHDACSGGATARSLARGGPYGQHRAAGEGPRRQATRRGRRPRRARA